MAHVFRAEGCHDLPAQVEHTESGDLITTAWQLEPAELAAVCATGLVVVQFLGAQPPVSVTGPHLEQPPELRFRVTYNGVLTPNAHLTDQATEVPTITDVMTLVLHAFMNDAQRVTVERL